MGRVVSFHGAVILAVEELPSQDTVFVRRVVSFDGAVSLAIEELHFPRYRLKRIIATVF